MDIMELEAIGELVGGVAEAPGPSLMRPISSDRTASKGTGGA